MVGHQTIKVCHLASGDLWAGAEVQIFTMLKSMSPMASIELSAVLLNEGRLALELKRIGIEVEVIDEQQHGFLTILSRLKEIMKEQGLDILHSHRYKENILGGLLKSGGHVGRLVQTVHGVEESFTGVKKVKAGFYNWLNHRYTNKYYDRVAAVSHDIQGRLASWLPSHRISVVYNAVDLKEIQPGIDSSEIRKQLKIPVDVTVIGSAGRLVGIKGYDILLQAMAELIRRRRHVHLLLAGDGPLRNDLQGLSTKLEIADHVTFAGFRTDIIDVLNAMDIFVMSSLHEGIPTILLEAMTLAKPVVVTAVGGMVDVVEDEHSGLLIPASEPSAMATACTRLIDDEALASRIAQAGMDRVANNFSNTIQATAVSNLYRELMN